MDRLRKPFAGAGIIALCWCAAALAEAVVATVNTGSTPYGLCIDSVTNRIYVANNDDNTVTVINGATDSTTSVNVGAQPFAIAVNPATNTIYAADQGDNNVSVIKGTTNGVSFVNVGGEAWSIAANPANNKIYSLVPAGIAIINGATNAVTLDSASTSDIATGATVNGIAINPATTMVYAVYGTNIASVINGSTNAASKVTVNPNTIWMAINSTTNMAYTSNGEINSIMAINGATNAVDSVGSGSYPYGALAVNAVTNMLYAESWGGIAAINLTANATTIIPTGGIPYALAVNPVTNMVYAANGDSNTVSIVNAATNSFTNLKVGAYPCDLAFNSVTGLIYVANADGNTVTVIACSSPAPVLAAPPNGAVNQPLQVALSWTGAAWAKSYDVRVSTAAVFTSTIFSQAGVTGTAVTTGALSLGATCYWRVNAVNAGGTSAWSATWSFTTVLLPAAPLLAVPANAAQNQPVTGLTLSWTSGAGSPVTSYQVQISTNNFAATLYNWSSVAAGSQIVSGLTASTPYFWRVNASGPGGNSAWSGTWMFTTASQPGAPALSSPSNNTVTRATSISFGWGSVAAASSYGLQVSTSSGFGTTVYAQTGLTATSRIVQGLAGGRSYYWRANAGGPGGAGVWSAPWTFSVTTTAALPLEPVASSPAFSLRNGVVTYTLAHECPIELKVCDILGRELFVFRRVQAAGTYSLQIHGLNPVSKLYLVQFRAGGLERRIAVAGR